MRDWRARTGVLSTRGGLARDLGAFGREGVGRAALIGTEILIGVALATGGVAALQSSAPVQGLGILYLLAVLAVAIRRGQVPALITAVLSVLTLNYLYIPPRHQLSIAHSSDLVELIVLLIAAVVVGRLAAVARERAGEAESRARLAAAREREAKLLAEVASAILAGDSVEAQLESIARRIAQATGARGARVVLAPVPAPRAEEITTRLPVRAGNAWLYLTRDVGWEPEAIERVAEPIGRLVDVAVERERVSERAAENEAARRAEVAKTAILHAISHDLRSPLTAITTAGSALGIGVSEAERSELIEVIETESARLARLVDDLLDLSRIESGAVAPQADWCDLHDVVASAAAHAGNEHPIEFALPADLPLVRADAAQLERVFSNLIENAVKFSPAGTPVRISGGAGAGRVAVRVADRGSGIARRYRSQVFEPFFRGRGPGAEADGASGSGLGLAICRGFVEANGGRIVLQTGRDTGTTFTVSFPVAAQPAGAVSAGSS
jgi:two-component system, OmpR family, sensor histidine kinase KdpD